MPFFGDIPLIGILFRTTTKTVKKQNLVLMLTPYIIESEADLRKIYERKKEEREALLEAATAIDDPKLRAAIVALGEAVLSQPQQD